jgi:AraC family transcriptional regulator of adaptative response/methylated-DNA-[protein]-cysteine methyltransferase
MGLTMTTTELERTRTTRTTQAMGAVASDDDAWRAVDARDAAWDGRLVYAVKSTGIYCRPSCPSRRPARRNVRFFTDGAAARAAGFRACRRCAPDGAGRAEASVAEARRLLDAHVDSASDARLTLDRLAAAVSMSAFHLQRVFKAQIGLSPAEYLRARRAERLKVELRSGETVSRATYGAGFGSSSRAYDAADAHLGMTPGAYRQGGRGAVIRYAVRPTPFGHALVAATERGICSVALGDAPEALVSALAAEYPRATLVAGARSDGSAAAADAEFARWADAVVAQIEAGGSGAAALPLDVPGTAFQWRVWRALQAIPRGETRSYAEVAAAVGAPGSARAVAQACAANHVAVVVPCHRVVRSGGALSGYRWGVERKRRLLEAEVGGG